MQRELVRAIPDLQRPVLRVAETLQPVEPLGTWWWQRRLFSGVTVVDLIEALDDALPGELPKPMGGESERQYVIRLLDEVEPLAEDFTDEWLGKLVALALARTTGVFGLLTRVPFFATLARKALDPLVPELAFRLARRALA